MLSLLSRNPSQPFRVWWPPRTSMVALISHFYNGHLILYWKHYPLLLTTSIISYQNQITHRLLPFSIVNHRRLFLSGDVAATGATTTKKEGVCNGRFSHLKLNNNEDTSLLCRCSFTFNVNNHSSTSKDVINSLNLAASVKFIYFYLCLCVFYLVSLFFLGLSLLSWCLVKSLKSVLYPGAAPTFLLFIY